MFRFVERHSGRAAIDPVAEPYGVDWQELGETVTEAYRPVAPRRLLAELEG